LENNLLFLNGARPGPGAIVVISFFFDGGIPCSKNTHHPVSTFRAEHPILWYQLGGTVRSLVGLESMVLFVPALIVTDSGALDGWIPNAMRTF
jgi:hypothetical protein